MHEHHRAARPRRARRPRPGAELHGEVGGGSPRRRGGRRPRPASGRAGRPCPAPTRPRRRARGCTASTHDVAGEVEVDRRRRAREGRRARRPGRRSSCPPPPRRRSRPAAPDAAATPSSPKASSGAEGAVGHHPLDALGQRRGQPEGPRRPRRPRRHAAPLDAQVVEQHGDVVAPGRQVRRGLRVGAAVAGPVDGDEPHADAGAPGRRRDGGPGGSPARRGGTAPARRRGRRRRRRRARARRPASPRSSARGTRRPPRPPSLAQRRTCSHIRCVHTRSRSRFAAEPNLQSHPVCPAPDPGAGSQRGAARRRCRLPGRAGPAAGGADAPHRHRRRRRARPTSHLAGDAGRGPRRGPRPAARAPAPQVTTDAAALAEASRDWWPLAMCWATAGEVAALADAVCRPESAAEVAAVLAVCNTARVPVTAAAGRSGVLGGSVPGPRRRRARPHRALGHRRRRRHVARARRAGRHVRHAARGDPRAPTTASPSGTGRSRSTSRPSAAGSPAAAPASSPAATARSRTSSSASTSSSPTAARSPPAAPPARRSGPTSTSCSSAARARSASSPAPACDCTRRPPHHGRTAWGFATFAAALDAQRAIVQRGATPAVLRLYDATEAARGYQTPEGVHLLHGLRRGRRGARRGHAPHRRRGRAPTPAPTTPSTTDLVEQWLGKRNDVAALEALISRGYVVDTMEVAGRWRDLPGHLRRDLRARCSAVPGTIAASAHQSHSYPDGACLYFTFAGQVEADERTAYHRALWDAGQRRGPRRRCRRLSHHHGVGLARGRFVAEALGPGVRRARRHQGGARPQRHPQPRQARPAQPVGAVAWLRARLGAPSGLGALVTMAVGIPVATIGSVILDDGSDARVLLRPRRRARLPRRRLRGRLEAARHADGPRRGGGARRLRRGAGRRRRSSSVVARRGREPVAIAFNALLAANIGLARRPARRPPDRAPADGSMTSGLDPRRRRRHVVGARRRRAPRRAPSSTCTTRVTLPDSPAPGAGRVRRRARSPTPPSTSPAPPSPTAGRSAAVGITNQRASTIVWDRATGEPVGPALGWQDLRTIGDCLVLQAEGIRLAPNVSATKAAPPARPRRSRPHPRPLLRHRRHLDRVATCRRARLHVTDATNAARHRPHHPRRRRLGRRRCCATLRIPERALPTIVDSSGVLGEATRARRRAADRRHRRRPAGVAARPGLHRRPASPRSPSAPAGCSTPSSASTARASTRAAAAGCFPIVARRLGGATTWGVEAAMLSAGTNVEWLRDDLGLLPSSEASHEVAASVPDTGGAWYVPGPARARARRTGTTAPGARCSASPGARPPLTSCGRCSRASPTAAPTSSRRPRPTAATPIAALRVDGGMSANPTFVQALADASQPARRGLAGHSRRRRSAPRSSPAWPSARGARSTTSPPRGVRPAPSSRRHAGP